METRTYECASCGGTLHWTQWQWELHAVERIYDDGDVELSSVIDTGDVPAYEAHLQCRDCGKTYTVWDGELSRHYPPADMRPSHRPGTVRSGDVDLAFVLDLNTCHIPWQGRLSVQERLAGAGMARWDHLATLERLRGLREAFNLIGGRNVELADHIDMVEAALFAQFGGEAAYRLASINGEDFKHSHEGFGCRCVPHDRGWTVFVPGVDGLNASFDMGAVPEWFQPILHFAREHKALIINFDESGPVWAEFRDYTVR